MAIISETKVKVRYSETDQMGVVYHGNYAQYLELSRIGWLDQLGVSYKLMEENGVMLPVYEIALKYKKSAYFDDVLKIETCLKKKPTARIEFSYKIYNQHEELLTTAVTTLVFVDAETRKPMVCPDDIMEKIEEKLLLGV